MADKYTNYKRKFNEDKYDRLYITVPKGHKSTIGQAAELVDESINEFVSKAIDERMERLGY